MSKRVPRAPVRILCIDDHPIVRQGIDLIIRPHTDLALVGSAATGEEGLKLFRRLQPSVTLMDLELPGISGLECIKLCRQEQPGCRIVVLTMHEEDEVIYQSLQAGATTYLLKDTLSNDLIRVMREVNRGNAPIPPRIASLLAERECFPQLSDREAEVLILMSRGYPNKQISSALEVTDETVHKHVAKIFTKLHVRNRTEAVSEALRRGLVLFR